MSTPRFRGSNASSLCYSCYFRIVTNPPIVTIVVELQQETWRSAMFGPQVYDVTHFAKIHPGGPGRIQMAAGSDLQKYFDVARAVGYCGIMGWPRSIGMMLQLYI